MAWVKGARHLSSSQANLPSLNSLKLLEIPEEAPLVLDAVTRLMPHYLLDDTFAEQLPEALVSLFAQWRNSRAAVNGIAGSVVSPKRW